MSLMFSCPFCTVVQLVANIMLVNKNCQTQQYFFTNVYMLYVFVDEKSTTFVSSLHKWGHATWICKGSPFALSTYTSKIICAVLDVWRTVVALTQYCKLKRFFICSLVAKYACIYVTILDWERRIGIAMQSSDNVNNVWCLCWVQWRRQWLQFAWKRGWHIMQLWLL